MLVNHARTILLNRAALEMAAVSDAEYIPPAFTPIRTDDQILIGFKNTVFPAGIDLSTENFILTALMKILHAPELESYTLMFDDRVTYTTDLSNLSELFDSRVSIDTTYQGAASDIEPRYVITEAGRPQALGLAGEHVWTFTDVDAYTLGINYSKGGKTEVQVVDRAGANRTEDIPLVNGYLTAYFNLPSNTLTGTYRIVYRTHIPPAYTPVDILTNLERFLVKPLALSTIFRDRGVYSTELGELKTIWLNSKEAPLKLGALILAYLVQMEWTRRTSTS